MSDAQKTDFKINNAVLVGRIKTMRKSTDFVHTEITQPAPDEYSMPGVVEVRSKKRIGQIGEDVRIPVQCGGYYGKPFQVADRETGEMVIRRPVVNVYTAIEV